MTMVIIQWMMTMVIICQMLVVVNPAKTLENTGETDDHMMTMVIILNMMTMQFLMMSMVIK